jgi:hypothetical protein
MGGMRLRGLWLAECVAAIVLLTTAPVSAFIVVDGEEGRVIQTLIQTEILPLFEHAPGIVSGIEDLTVDQDPDDARIRIWVISVVLTEQTATGIAIIQKELTFRGALGTVPHLVNQGTPRPWPDTPATPPN